MESTYVGLTDDPARSKVEHGNPAGWKDDYGPFKIEKDAQEWKRLLVLAGFQNCGDNGWRRGYTFTRNTKK